MAKETKVPDDLRYTKEHEWIQVEGKRARIGITDYAQDALTDVVFAELPDVGDHFKEHDSLGVVESVKSVSDIYCPLAGKVVEVNEALEESPELMNQDPYGKGWFCVIELDHAADVEKLMDARSYRSLLHHAH